MSTNHVTGGLRSLAEILESAGAREQLPVSDRGHPRGYELDDQWLTLWWGGYEYNIARDRIDTPEKLLGWLAHIGGKTWAGTTPERIDNLIRALARRHGWQIEGM